MFHEVLMALVGYSGTFLQEVVEDDSLFHLGDKSLIKRILKIAQGYTSLKHFIDRNICVVGIDTIKLGNKNDKENSCGPPGVYLQAFCNGLKEVLKPYNDDIVKLEEKSLTDPHISLLTIAGKVEEYSKLFEVLNSLIKEISEQNIHGCQILDLLHREMSTNVDDIKDSLRCIIHHCHIVFFKHLSNWILYGQLIDRYNEFFIQHALESADDHTPTTSAMDSFSSHDLNDLCLRPNNRGSSHRYAIQYSMLPSYIAPSVAQKIIFIGETILMCGCEPKERGKLNIASKYILSIWGGREVEFYKKLQSLQAMKTFNRTQFEKTIDEFRSCVTEHLWKIAVEEAELFLQLKVMKDFFLLGRGELFLEFIRQAGPILQISLVGTSARDVNQAFHIAARKILMNDDIVDKFTFTLPDKDQKESDCVKGNCWQLLTLTYKVSWPLHLLFDSVVLDNYNKLFKFLLRVKKTQLDLHNVWRNHMKCKTKQIFEGESAVWHLRNRLMFLVDNLQYYLQVDVLESQYMILQSAVQATKDFEQIQKAHTLFQANILSQTFLLTEQISEGEESNPVQSVLAKVLSLCEKFCIFVDKWENDISKTEVAELDDMVTKYEYLVTFLLDLLSNLSLHPCGSHLSQLLLRLDFNRWFSKQRNNTEIDVSS